MLSERNKELYAWGEFFSTASYPNPGTVLEEKQQFHG